MRECLRCGKPLPPRIEKGHRERNYCSDRCRQRACRERNRQKYNLDRIIKEANERIWNAIEQQVHRETWQNELEYYHRVRDHMLKELAFMEEQQISLQ